ncbi:hypothetical protein [Lactiplantibacillus songbeiensis]|uniref:Cell surface protein n=1 Tax=Lactiplantibacillus songbeiensis TaxID=2559920 RepID=A0ABW4C576_9LACO|nr:hypothetical protein [Lactiplantibacillus songbeiensis]
MTHQLIWRRLILLLAILLGVVWGHAQVATAAASGTTGTANFTPSPTGTRLKAYDGYTVGPYLGISKVTANNVQNNRLTRYTTQITVTLSSGANQMGGSNYDLGQAHLDVLDAQGNSLLSSTSTAAKISGMIATFTPTTQVLKVDLSKLGTADLKAPIFVGASFTPKNSTITGDPMWMAYGFGEFKKDDVTTNNMKDVTINEPVQINDQTITGTADPGARVSVSLNGKSFEATADTDGKYTLSLGLPLSLLGNPDSITVYEGNDMGDTKTATAKVLKSVPVLDATSKELTITPADAENLSSDDDVLKWIVDKAGIEVKDSSTAVTDDKATYSSTDSDLAQKLTALASGDSTTIDVGATSNGVKAPTDLSIKITKGAGELKFTTVSDKLSYGDLQVPNTTTLFAPTSAPDVEISDTRMAGSPWRVTASADIPVDTADAKHTLSGQLMYVDASGQAKSLATSQTVATGTRAKGGDKVNVTDGWETQADKPSGVGKTGIYLQAKPNIYTGSGAASYSGTVTWGLIDAP